MAKILVTAEVEDAAKWEESFRTHGSLFSGYGVNSPILLGIGENNCVAVLEDVDDVEAVLATLEAPDNVEAMEADGVKRDTVQVFVLDKEFSF